MEYAGNLSAFLNSSVTLLNGAIYKFNLFLLIIVASVCLTGCSSTCQNCGYRRFQQVVAQNLSTGENRTVGADGNGCARITITSGNCSDWQWSPP
jgi:hypothetical protein